MIWEIPKLGEFIKKPRKAARLYEFYDNFHMVTIYVLGFFALLTGAKQHFGNPIDCIMSKQHDDIKPWRDYIQHFCLFYGTFRYEVHNESRHLKFGSYTEDATINYYQWVPFFFAFQVCCFFLPFWCWTYMQQLFYIDMAFIVEYISNIKKEETLDQNEKKIKKIVDYMDEHFRYRRTRKQGYFSWITFHSAFPSILYFITKLLFIANVVFQVKIVCKFLGVESWTWGFDLLEKFLYPVSRSKDFYSWSDKQKFAYMITDGSLNRFQYFPILVGCEYQLQESVDRLVSHTTQCIIPVNIINEKLFIGVYFWLLLLTAMSVIGAVKWLIRMKSSKFSESMIYELLEETLQKEHLAIGTNYNDYRYDFVHKYLCSDGIFLIYLMKDANGFLKTEEVVGALFKKYCEDGALEPTAPTLSDRSVGGNRGKFSEVNYGFEPHLEVHQKL